MEILYYTYFHYTYKSNPIYNIVQKIFIMINNHHQDWETVVFKKKSNKQQQPQPKSSSSAAGDDAVKKTKYISKETSLAIISARCSKQMTQKDLAQKCNFDISIITNIEKGVSVYNATHVNRIQTVLGAVIPR